MQKIFPDVRQQLLECEKVQDYKNHGNIPTLSQTADSC